MEWSAALTPELAMIPDRGVFLRAAQGRSLTATVKGIASDIWNEDVTASIHAITVGAGEREEIVGAEVVEEVEELCCCGTLLPEPKQEHEENRGWLDLVLFV